MTGVKFFNVSRSVGVKFNQFRYIISVAVTAEKPFSNEYVGGKGNRTFNAFSHNRLWT